MVKCPLTKQECTSDCAWFIDGECCIVCLPDLVEKLEDVVTSAESLERTINNKNFAE